MGMDLKEIEKLIKEATITAVAESMAASASVCDKASLSAVSEAIVETLVPGV